jgi:hypothetical protein
LKNKNRKPKNKRKENEKKNVFSGIIKYNKCPFTTNDNKFDSFV